MLPRLTMLQTPMSFLCKQVDPGIAYIDRAEYVHLGLFNNQLVIS